MPFELRQQRLRVDTEIVRVGPEEAAHVHGRRQNIELLSLQRFEEPRRNSCLLRDLVDGETALFACAAERVADTCQDATSNWGT